MQVDPAKRSEIIRVATEIAETGGSPELVEELAGLVGMDPAHIEEAKQRGLCTTSDVGQLEGNVMVLMLPEADVAKLLPVGLQLAPNPVSPPGKHPVIVQFGHLHFDFASMDYDEVMIRVPWVELSVWKAPRRGPFIYMPRLYLNERLPELLGHLIYGYEKQLATIDLEEPEGTDAGHGRVLSREDDVLYLEATFTPEGAKGPVSSFASFTELRQLFEMPTISQAARIWDPDAFESDELSPFLASNLVYMFDAPDTWVQPIAVDLKVTDALTPPGIPVGEYHSPSLEQAPLGAFRISTKLGVALPGGPATLRYPMPKPARKQRVLVLGSGPSASAAAFWLAKQTDRYEVDMYTLGWRMGGKCAAGRHHGGDNDRIEEHGLHAFLGFYENAIRTVRNAWLTAGLDPRDGDDPLGGAFLGSTRNGLMIELDGGWGYYNTPLPINDKIPGYVPPEARGDDGDLSGYMTPEHHRGIQAGMHNMASAFIEVFEYLARLTVGLATGHKDAHDALQKHTKHAMHGPVLENLRQRLHKLGHRVRSAGEGKLEEILREIVRYFENVAAMDFEKWLSEGLNGPLRFVAGLAKTLRSLATTIVNLFGSNDEVWYLWMSFDTVLTVVIGVITDQVAHLDQLDDIDTWDWLKKHGLDPRLIPEELRDEPVEGGQVQGSPAVAAVYETLFAHGDDDPPRPRNMAASVGIRWLLLSGFGYAGYPAYEFKYSCPQTLLTPYYKALTEKLGARIHFFHKVTEVVVEGEGDARRLVKVKLQVQATVKGGSDKYDPFMDPQPAGNPPDLPAWPMVPNYGQLEEGAELERRQINLEDSWTDWEGVGEIELVQGRDFDLCVLGISLGALAPLTRQLWDPEAPTHDPRWKNMVDNVFVTQTVSFQLWFDTDQAGLYGGNRGLLTEYVLPEPSWSNFTHLVQWEGWGENPPKFLAYHTGSLTAKSVFDHEPFDNHEWYAQATEAWIQQACKWTRDNHFAFYDAAPEDWEGFTALLRAPEGTTGEDRFRAQYFNAGVPMSDRYVTSQPRGMRARLGQMDSGVRNLFLCGDWTDTDVNAGCVEAATQAGMLCARGICQHPVYVWRTEF